MIKTLRQPVRRRRQTCAPAQTGRFHDQNPKAAGAPVQADLCSGSDRHIPRSKPQSNRCTGSGRPARRPRPAHCIVKSLNAAGAPAETGRCHTVAPALAARCTAFRGCSRITSTPQAGAPVVKFRCSKRTTFSLQDTTEYQPVHGGAGLSASAPACQSGAAPI
jgi:hypothetical protein